MRVAIGQLNIQFEEKEKNLRHAETILVEAARTHAALILFPEMSFTGFSMNLEKTAEEREEAEKENGTIGRMKALCRQYQIAAGFGWTSWSSQSTKAENHYLVVDKNGETLADYVKIHPFSMGNEDSFFIKGDHVVQYTIEGIQCSHFICYDLRFPEIFQEACRTSECIFLASNWPEERIDQYHALLCARAIETQSYVCGINCTGTQESIHYNGGSCVFDSTGAVKLMMTQNLELAYVEIPEGIGKQRESFPIARDRRPDLYTKFYEGAKHHEI